MITINITGLAPPFSTLPSTLLFGFSVEKVPQKDLEPGDTWAIMIVFLFWKFTIWNNERNVPSNFV